MSRQDDLERIRRRRVWIVDPLDGTREFIAGVPHWSVSIGLAEDGEAVAGGIYNPSTDELFLGARETGVTLNGTLITVSERVSLEGATVLSNRWALRKRPAEFNAWPPRSPGIVATNGAIHRAVQRFIAGLPKPRR